MQAPLPDNETDRLAALYALDILDSAAGARTSTTSSRSPSNVCGTPMSLVSLIDADRQWFKARVGTDLTETPRDISFCAHAILGRDLLVVPDAHARTPASPTTRRCDRTAASASTPAPR